MITCPVQNSLKLIGGKWKISILYSLRNEPIRFGALRRLHTPITQQMLSKQLREMELENLINRIDGFLINIKSYNDNIINVRPSPNITDGFEMKIQNEDDTLGNIIQEEFFELFCNEDDEDDEKQLLEYIGYKRTHPLEEIIIINIKSSKYKSWSDYITNIFDVGCKHIIKKLNAIKKDLENQKEFIKELKSI